MTELLHECERIHRGRVCAPSAINAGPATRVIDNDVDPNDRTRSKFLKECVVEGGSIAQYLTGSSKLDMTMMSSFSCKVSAAAAVLLLLVGASPAFAGYGAIAYSQSSGAFGFSHDYPSRRAAERRALSECSARSRGCRTAIWFTKACGAVAVGHRGGWGSAWGSSPRVASRKALGQCARHTSNCSVLVTHCSR
ncbi:DUF4189 domain-containing protein [Aurantimonas sp. VKM B-3413]|uniref:DUF4189 domain-containing protein n=1 Tax=Aurantimonas sp. VKM B-3413 TaxID=2779401 RepID=UPI001E2CE00C|nr:DUF4189 domain-containing protein [Aurantimonas sp. VKM B-3413]MCB8836057.1 DUF4189 domain-containing protein [Aurantimonas sp. VKM B-3413]